jgi:GT2 family glycosyltransferase
MTDPPFVSVIVRSCGRPREVMELIGRLTRQTYARFEIVVCDQTGSPELLARMKAEGGPLIRVIARPPLGASGARNEAVRHARGEILAFIDDDDLPFDDDWLALHVANYEDPNCMGVNGRHVHGPQGSPAPRFAGRAYRLCFRHTFWKDTTSFVTSARRKVGVDFLFGTNSSVRREVVERIGGWDEGVPTWGEEQSFAFKLKRAKRCGEYLVFDPRPQIWRRTDIPGGADRRTVHGWHRKELAARVGYYHRVVGHYYPWRFRLLYPFYALRTLVQMEDWIWDGDNKWHGLANRLAASVDVAVRLPLFLWREARAGHVAKRITKLDPGTAPDDGPSALPTPASARS